MLVVLSATLMFADLFVAVMKETVSVAVMQLEASATLMQAKVSAANMWVAIFIEIIKGRSLCCNHAGGIFYSVLFT